MRRHKLLGAFVVLLASCEVPPLDLTITLDEQDGIPPIEGQTDVTLPANFQCGDAIQSDGAFAITSEQLGNGNCLLHMEGEFELISEELYNSAPELAGNSVNLVQAINLQISTMTISDNGTPLVLADTFDAVDVFVLGEQILDLATIATIPTTVELGQAALDEVKTGLVNRTPVTVTSVIDAEIKAAVVGSFPQAVSVDFVAQPEIVLGVSPLVR